METAKRELTFLLAGPEHRLLRAIAARLPRAIVPDHLTLLGVLGAAGTALGLDAATAALLAQKSLAGAGRMAESGPDVTELRANVTSRGGTTEAAVAHLERGGLRPLFAGAVRAGADRGREIGDALAK